MCEKILRKPIRFPGKYSISMDAQQVIRGFLDRNPQERLGGIRTGGLSTLQDHIFFTDTDWDMVLRGQGRPPFIPLSGPDPADTRNFDVEFTKLSVKDVRGEREDEEGGGRKGGGGVESTQDYDGFSFLDDEYKQLLSELEGGVGGGGGLGGFYDPVVGGSGGGNDELDDDRPSMD
jgi:hypothetical protein